MKYKCGRKWTVSFQGKNNWASKNPQRASLIRRGENNARAKLTEAQVVEILRAAKNHTKHNKTRFIAKLAAKYGVRDVTMSRVVYRRSWKHVSE